MKLTIGQATWTGSLPSYRNWAVWLRRSGDGMALSPDELFLGQPTNPEMADLRILGPIYLARCGMVWHALVLIIVVFALVSAAAIFSAYWLLPALAVWIASPDFMHWIHSSAVRKNYRFFGAFGGYSMNALEAAELYNRNVRHLLTLYERDEDEDLRRLVAASNSAGSSLDDLCIQPGIRAPESYAPEGYRESALLHVVEISFDSVVLGQLIRANKLDPVLAEANARWKQMLLDEESFKQQRTALAPDHTG